MSEKDLSSLLATTKKAGDHRVKMDHGMSVQDFANEYMGKDKDFFYTKKKISEFSNPLQRAAIHYRYVTKLYTGLSNTWTPEKATCSVEKQKYDKFLPQFKKIIVGQVMSNLENDIFEKDYQRSYDYNSEGQVKGLNTVSYLHEERIEKLENQCRKLFKIIEKQEHTNEVLNYKIEKLETENKTLKKEVQKKSSSIENKILDLQEESTRLSQNVCGKLIRDNKNKNILFFIILFYFRYFYKPKFSTLLELPSS